MLALLATLYEEAKHNLVTASAEDTPRLQGAAIAYRRVIDMVTRPSLTKTEDTQ